MKAKEAKSYLNQRVHYKSRNVNADYMFTACTIRKVGDGFIYQAELQDLNNSRSIVIAKLDDVEPLKE